MEMEQAASFGQLLRQFRLAAGLTQEQLAERARLSAQAISSLERGIRQAPHRATVGLLAEALGLSRDQRLQLEEIVRRGRRRVAAEPLNRWSLIGADGGCRPLILEHRHPRLSPAAEVDVPGSGPARPPALTSFVGRARELALIQSLLTSARLVTLTGPPGVGKTRLALKVAAERAATFPDGVFVVPLADVADPALVLRRIAQVVGVREYGARSVRELLIDYLRDKAALVVLDNFEHVLAAAPDASNLLTSCPRLTILVTSRAPLRVYGEQELLVAPLPLPAWRRDEGDGVAASWGPPVGAPAGSEVARSEAVRLFVDRARAIVPEFELGPDNALAVAEICHRLDGLPLAIELAATRVRLLAPDALLRRLGQRLPLLAGGPRDLPARHQTMRDAIAWSFDLLSARAQLMFARLGVFVGGCTLEAVEAVCSGDGLPTREVVETIDALVENSLLQPMGVAGARGRIESRVHLLEVLREFALERLADRGELEAIRRRHAAHYLRIAEAAGAELRGPEQIAWLERLEDDLGNLRAALRWSLDQADPDARLRLPSALWPFWEIRGYFSEGRRWLEEALDRAADASDGARAGALLGAGMLADCQGEYAAANDRYHAALALFRSRDDRRGAATALGRLGVTAVIQGNHAAATVLLDESLALARTVGDERVQAIALNGLGYRSSLQADFERAAALLTESVALARKVGDRRVVAMPLLNLGLTVDYAEEPARAAGYLEESLALWREVGDRRWSAQARNNLADVALVQGDVGQARLLLAENLVTFRDLGDKWGLAFCLEMCAAFNAADGRPEAAARLWGAASALRGQIGFPLFPSLRIRYDQRVAAARERLSPGDFARAWSEGEALPLDQAVQYALNACRA